MIGHALSFAPTLAGRIVWDRWIAIGFAIGSACFFIGPFPGFVQLVGTGADGVVFFAGSIFLTCAALLRGARVHSTAGTLGGRSLVWSAAIQFVGTLFFNLSTFAAMQEAGCVLFGISGIASFIVPSNGSMLDLAAANWTTGLGALCFFVGSLLLLPPRHGGVTPADSRPLVPTEV